MGGFIGAHSDGVDPREVIRSPEGRLYAGEPAAIPEKDASREDPSQGAEVLVGASVRHAMELFPHFSTESLRGKGQDACEPAPEPAARSVAGDVAAVLRSLRQWEDEGLILPDEAQEQRRHLLRGFGERALGGEGDD